MSVVRWSTSSDIYVYLGGDGWNCHHRDGGKCVGMTYGQAAAHIAEHIKAGSVDKRALIWLAEEAVGREGEDVMGI